jgi:RNA polymerase sigma factor (sigma-70 family)
MMPRDENTEAKAIFEILVRENQAMLMTYLRAAVRNSSVVDDLFQEAMLVAWRRLGEYDRSRPFGPWLRGIAGRLIMAHFRKIGSVATALEEETLEYVSAQLQHICERPGDTWDEKIEALTHCIEALSEQYRQAVRLRYFEQTTPSVIAEASGASLETVKKRLQRARLQLLECLRRKRVFAEVPA